MHKRIKGLEMIFVSVMVIFLCALFSEPATGQEVSAAAQEKSKWEVAVIPYFWMAGLSGNVTVKGVEASANYNFNKIWNHLDVGVQGYVETRYGKCGLFFDGTYLKLSADVDTFSPRLGPVDADLSVKLTIIELGGLYEIGKWSLGDGKDASVRLDALGGGRYWNLSGSVNANASSVPLVIDASETKQWVDPFIGLRAQAFLTKRLRFVLRGDVGGFGAGSDFTWNGIGVFGYSFSDMITGWLGYRALGVDYQTGSGTGKFKFDVIMHGPIAGIGFRF